MTGSFFSFIAALLLAYEPGKNLARLNLDIQHGLTGARLIYEVLDTPATEAAAARTCRSSTCAKAASSSTNVRFAYRDSEYVLDGLDLASGRMQTTALVGASGGGKSTIPIA